MTSPTQTAVAVALRPLRALFAVAREHGVDVDTIIRDAGLDADLLDSAEARADSLRTREVLLAISRKIGDVPLGLYAAERLKEGDLGLFDFLVGASDTLREAATLTQSFYPLMDQSAELRLEEDGRIARTVLVPRTRPVVLPLLAEFTLGAIAQLARRFTGHALRADEVCFVHRRDRHRATFEEFFQAKVTFGAERDEILYPRIYLDLALPKGDPALRQTLMEHARRLLSEARPPETFVARVRRHILEDLRSGETALDSLAGRLGLGRRTLQRRLQELGTSHQQLVDDVRRELALEYLEHTDWSVSKVASVLGFSDASTFSRAFRRWMATSPGRFKGGDTAARRMATEAPDSGDPARSGVEPTGAERSVPERPVPERPASERSVLADPGSGAELGS